MTREEAVNFIDEVIMDLWPNTKIMGTNLIEDIWITLLERLDKDNATQAAIECKMSSSGQYNTIQPNVFRSFANKYVKFTGKPRRKVFLQNKDNGVFYPVHIEPDHVGYEDRLLKLANSHTPGDWVIRTDVTEEQIAKERHDIWNLNTKSSENPDHKDAHVLQKEVEKSLFSIQAKQKNMPLPF